MEARLITFRKLKELCGDVHIEVNDKLKILYYCHRDVINKREVKCTAKNCPVWKGLKEKK